MFVKCALWINWTQFHSGGKALGGYSLHNFSPCENFFFSHLQKTRSVASPKKVSRSLPYPEPARLCQIKNKRGLVSTPDFWPELCKQPCFLQGPPLVSNILLARGPRGRWQDPATGHTGSHSQRNTWHGPDLLQWTARRQQSWRMKFRDVGWATCQSVSFMCEIKVDLLHIKCS